MFPLPWMTAMTTLAILSGTAGHGGLSIISCDCSTAQCEQQGTSVCSTGGLCFVQYLDRGHQAPSILRGCTEGRTPLLCENRKPSRAKKWPLLHCCGTDFCNRNAVPTPPGAAVSGDGSAFNTLDIQNVAATSNDSNLPQPAPESSPSSLLSSSVQRRNSPWPHIVSPVYVSVLVLGIVSLVIIGVVAAAVIRRSNRFYADHYSTAELRRGKAAAHAHCDCDSDIESVESSQPYLHMVCPNRRDT